MLNFFKRNSPNKIGPQNNAGLKHWENGKALYDSDKLRALTEFDRAIHFEYIEAHIDRAICLHALKFYYDAIQDYNISIANKPNDPNLYFQRALSFEKLGCINVALEDCRMAIEYSQDNSLMNLKYREASEKMGWNSHTDFYEFHYNYLVGELDFLKNDSPAARTIYRPIQVASIERRPNK